MRFPGTLIVKLGISVVLTSSAVTALAQSTGVRMVSAGWLRLQAAQDAPGPVYITSPISRTLPPVSGEAETLNTLTVSLSLVNFLTKNWAYEFNIASPPKITVIGNKELTSLGALATARQWTVAGKVKYFFGEPRAKWRPSIGLGVLYSMPTNIELTDSYQRYLGTRYGDPTARSEGHVDNEWAPLVELGLIYNLNKDWAVNFTASYVKMDRTTHVTSKTSAALGTVETVSTGNADTISTFLGIGYRF